MNDYTDLFYTLMAVAIFSFFLLHANGAILSNQTRTVDHEYEKTAISVAQSIIDEAKTLEFDWAIIDGVTPDEFPGEFLGFDERGGSDRENFAVFDDYHFYSQNPLIVPTELGNYTVRITVDFVEVEEVGGVTVVSAPSLTTSFNKRMTVTASNIANDDFATLTYIKSYFPM